jgi:hypothetical protein
VARSFRYGCRNALPGVSYFSPEATFVRTVALDLPEEGYRPQAISQLDDGTIFAMASRGFGAADAGTVIRDSTRFYSYSQDGKVSSKIAVLPSAERWGLLAGGVLMFPYVPFTAQLLWATGSGEIHITTGKGGEVRSWDNMGRLVQISRWRIVARPVTDEIRDNYRRDLLASTTSDDARRRYEVFLAETPMADTLPAYQTMLVDVLGNRWLERYRASGETQPAWDVISADGAWLGSVPMPARFSLRQVGRDFVLGVWRDDDDVEHVHRYDLIKAGSR